MRREIVCGALLSALLLVLVPQSTVSAACVPGSNPVVCENSLAGNPASEWDIADAGDSSIQGFATDISVNLGETARFKVKTDATAYWLDIYIYRIGFYAGMGARRVATVRPVDCAAAEPTRMRHSDRDGTDRLWELDSLYAGAPACRPYKVRHRQAIDDQFTFGDVSVGWCSSNRHGSDEARASRWPSERP
jgi:hypothetical protein